MLYVFNKMDALSDEVLPAFQDRMRNLIPDSIFVSALQTDGLESLRRALLARARANTSVAEIRIPASNGRLLAEIYRDAEVLDQRTDGEELVLRARVGEQQAGRFRKAGAGIAV